MVSVPSHVRHLAPCGFEPADATGNQSEPLLPVALVTVAEEQLKTEADAQDGPARGGHRADRPVEAAVAQRLGGRRERPHAGEHQAVTAGQLVAVRAEHRLAAAVDDGALNAAQVADAVIAHADARSRRGHNVPLVEGMPPPITVSACLVARPIALNAASAM